MGKLILPGQYAGRIDHPVSRYVAVACMMLPQSVSYHPGRSQGQEVRNDAVGRDPAGWYLFHQLIYRLVIAFHQFYLTFALKITNIVMETQSVEFIIMGVMTLTDARYFSAMEAKYLHFDLNPESPWAIDQHSWQAIIEWVEGSEIICSFDHLFDDAAIREIVEDPRVTGVLSIYPDMLDHVSRMYPELKLFQRVDSPEEVDFHLPLTGVISPIVSPKYGNQFKLCNGPLEAVQAIGDGVSKVAIHPGNEDEVGIKDFEVWDTLWYGA